MFLNVQPTRPSPAVGPAAATLWRCWECPRSRPWPEQPSAAQSRRRSSSSRRRSLRRPPSTFPPLLSPPPPPFSLSPPAPGWRGAGDAARTDCSSASPQRYTKLDRCTLIFPVKIFTSQVEEVSMRVMRKELRGSRVVSEQLVTVAVERHLACACDCRAKEEVF